MCIAVVMLFAHSACIASFLHSTTAGQYKHVNMHPRSSDASCALQLDYQRSQATQLSSEVLTREQSMVKLQTDVHELSASVSALG